MNGLSKHLCFSLLYIDLFNLVRSQSNKAEEKKHFGCQEKSVSGRSYVGKGNTTSSGLPCQTWSNTETYDHPFAHVGDHNFCRNPNGASQTQVWCYTIGPDHMPDNCLVPFCPSLKALDFSLDNDDEPDKNNIFTHASLQKENLPLSFTICTSFMLDAWPEYEYAVLFLLRNDLGKTWHYVKAIATGFTFQFENLRYSVRRGTLLYPLQWTNVCLSRDSNASVVKLVVDGELLIEKHLDMKYKPNNLNLVLGLGWGHEYPGRTTNLNIFSSALPVEKMKSLTKPGAEECGLAGNFLSWQESLEQEQWSLHSKARWVDLDGGLESPCLVKSKMNVFPMIEFLWHSDCMDHCKKLGGRSPSVKAKADWDNFLKDIKLVSPDTSRLPKWTWLSATEGDIGYELREPDHWPEGIKAVEGVWRDYYTGEQLDNYTKPWYSPKGDTGVGEAYNCIDFYSTSIDVRALTEWRCGGRDRGCPCTFEKSPQIHLRGFCSNTKVEHKQYTVSQSAANPRNVIMVGLKSAQIEYDYSISQWVLSDPKLNVTARTRASQNSYALGKHIWTISGDNYMCFEGEDYTIEMKLTGCNKTQFTCNDGSCVKMEERCNQIPECKDKSDEKNCKVLKLDDGYNKRVPPVATTGREVKTLKQVHVNVSLTLYKVVAIQEEEHSIELQFQIRLEWNENRATYYNLKPKSYLNALSMDEINKLWLPIVVYLNTDQQETTRLGENWEWSTNVNVNREGNFVRSGYEVLDEIYLFKGEENSLIETQSYTHNFQCVYQLERYPFDTQVSSAPSLSY